jgi:hypothetical protein
MKVSFFKEFALVVLTCLRTIYPQAGVLHGELEGRNLAGPKLQKLLKEFQRTYPSSPPKTGSCPSPK